jgi:hypothetical protein
MTDGTFDWQEIILTENYSKKAMSDVEREFKSALYDNLYHRAGLILARHNPCSLKEGSCLQAGGHCCKNEDVCRYLGDNGCTVKALTCKLWLCDVAREKFPQCARALDGLAIIAKEYSLLATRTSKEDII